MLKGKTAVITGGVRGIGKCIAETFCKNGANVIIVDISSPEAFEATEAELKEYGTTVKSLNGDITDPETAKKVAQLIKDEFDKKVDILVNNAGITNDKLVMKMDPEDFSRVIDVNLNGAFYMTKEISALMVKQRSGSIISMSSVSGIKGNPAQVNYSASKAGLVGMTLSLAKELGRRGIRANAIAPGFIKTDMTGKLSEEQMAKAAEGICMKRVGVPQDIANTALFLASDLSEYVTGQVIAVDGGLIM
ncbi:MAG: 3-oxoacyl-[acyl-carrier-protein] reductase [Firmicutes bacterium]|nr:3-oxoacyl-[acyl-carrier-protein] reductase [Bacillota bacterium]MDY4958696.1 3-oxoacyl-[acyl-carrier-protein] reductase [Lentihominibacter sp.]